MTNQKQREASEKAARDLGCVESDDALDRAVGKVLKPVKPKDGEKADENKDKAGDD